MLLFSLRFEQEADGDEASEVKLAIVLDKANAAKLAAAIGKLPVGPSMSLYNALCNEVGDETVALAERGLI